MTRDETSPAAERPSSISKRGQSAGEFTPGPWIAAPITSDEWIVTTSDSYNVASVCGYCGKDAPDSPEANARLIAAAPELLAALISSEAEYENLEADAPVDSGCPDCTLNTVPATLDTGLCAHHLRVAAIAKATGA